MASYFPQVLYFVLRNTTQNFEFLTCSTESITVFKCSANCNENYCNEFLFKIWVLKHCRIRKMMHVLINITFRTLGY